MAVAKVKDDFLDIDKSKFEEFVNNVSVSTQTVLDDALETLQAHKDAWVALDISERIEILDEIRRDMQSVEERWVAFGMQAQDLRLGTFGEGEQKVLLGMVYRLVRLLRQSLVEIKRFGQPRIPGPVDIRANGQITAQVFPQAWHDRLTLQGIQGEIWMDPELTDLNKALSRASFYDDNGRSGRVALVLGAGNVSTLVPADFMYKLFVEGQVVILKTNPVNEYLGPLIEEGFQALIKRGFLRVVYGGIAEGSYLVQHPAVDEIHMTGSVKTFEAIKFGLGDEGARRKAARSPKITKRFTAELGNISPVIIVPGPWNSDDITTQAAKLSTWLSINAGFGCLTPRMIINWRRWEQRQTLIGSIGDFLSKIETRSAYYPGATDLHEMFRNEHPEALTFGETRDGYLPWTLIPDVDPHNNDDICFTCEAFTSLFAETALQADNVEDFIEKAVNFANDQLWGTLVASIIVHPKSMEDPKIAAAVDRAVERLRYGTVVINQWGVTAWMLMLTPWGGYPDHDIYNIQSGTGVVNNSLMFEHPQKSVVRAPFKLSPDPFLVTSKNVPEFGVRMVDFQKSPSIPNLLRLFRAAMKS